MKEVNKRKRILLCQMIKSYCPAYFWHEFLYNTQNGQQQLQKNHLAGDVKEAGGKVGVLFLRASVFMLWCTLSVGERVYNLDDHLGMQPLCDLLVALQKLLM